MQLGNHVLGGGFYATRLYHDLRQVAGYVYNVDVSMEASKTRASYSVTYGCDPDKVSKARALIQRDLDQMRTQDVTPDELHLAKALLLRQIPLGESSEEGVAQGLLRRAVIGFRSTSRLCGEEVLRAHCWSGQGSLRPPTETGRLRPGGERSCSAVERSKTRWQLR